MRNRRIWTIALIVVIVALASWAWGQVGGPGEEFSADQILTRPQGEEKGRIYCSNDRWRVDVSHQGKPMIQVFRLDKRVVWMIIPEDKVYMEMPLYLDQVPWAEKVPGEVERKSLGEEAVHGHPAKKYQVKVWNGETAGEFYLWVSVKLKVPVKTATLDGRFGSELRNIKVGPQPTDLFEVPSDYKRISPPPHP